MAILTNLREALAVQLNTLPGLKAYAQVPDSAYAPFAVVGVLPAGAPLVDYDNNFAGAFISKPGGTWNLLIRVFLGKVMDREAQKHLDDFIDPTGTRSIKYVIESNRRLSGACDDLVVKSAQNYGVVKVGTEDYLTVEFSVEIYT